MIRTKHNIISKNERMCSSLWSQMRGLMFRARQNLIMVFAEEQKIQLHNCFVFYTIELVFLNKNKKVIEIKPTFKPFTFYNSKHKAKYLVELGLGESQGKLKGGDILHF